MMSTPLGGTVINEAGATINVINQSGLQLQTGGTYTNNGTIHVGSTGAATYLQLSLGSGNTVDLEGSGSLTLSNNVNNFIAGVSPFFSAPSPSRASPWNTGECGT
jgi:hypothetical protein